MLPQPIRPKILGFISEDTAAWLVAVLAFLFSGIVTALLAYASYDLYRQQLRQRFELLANERFTRIEERFSDQVQRLDGLRRFILYSPSLSREQFNGYVRPLLGGALAYNWAPQVPDADRTAFEHGVVAEGFSQFRINDLSAKGDLVPAAVRTEYLPVFFSQSSHRTDSPLGYDMLSSPLRHEVFKRAAGSGTFAASAPLTLAGLREDEKRGVLLVASVVGPSWAGPGQAIRVPGFVSAAISLASLMSDGIPGVPDDNLQIVISDLAEPPANSVLFKTPVAATELDFIASHQLPMADRNYVVEIRPSNYFAVANRPMGIYLVSILGGLLSVMLSALLYNLINQRQRALTLVAKRTGQLLASERALRGTHGQLQSILDAATQVAIIATDLGGLITMFNAGAEHLLGYQQVQVVGLLTLDQLHDPQELRARTQHLQASTGCQVAPVQIILGEASDDQDASEWTLLRRDGGRLIVNMLTTSLLDEQDRQIGHLAICIDITQAKRTHEALESRDRLLQKLSAEVPGGIYQYLRMADGTSRFTYVSQGLCNIYELSAQQLLGSAGAAFDRIHHGDLERVRQSIIDSAQALTRWREEYRVVLPSSGVRWIRGEATPERLPDQATLWHGYFTDISDLKRVEEELRALSITDSLTGIYNRRYFQERLRTELNRAAREHLSLAVIMLDIDHFKQINDRYGHAEGDKVLQALCRQIRQRLRRTDVFCRLGGEEFMVLCPGSNEAQAYGLALELWKGLRESATDPVGVVTASFGLASWREGEDADALLLRADSGVYAAKQAGRDRVQPQLP